MEFFKSNVNRSSGEILYSNWINSKQENFARLYNSLKDYLPYISKGPLSVYIVYLIHANNETGSSFPSIDTIANMLDVSDRTINNWNSVLLDLGLIYREKTGSRLSSTTFLLPTSDYIVFKKTQNILSAINDLGYREHQKIIRFIQKDNHSYSNFEYKMFYREYSNNIVRKVFFGEKIGMNKEDKRKIEQLNLESAEIRWFEDNNILYFIFNETIIDTKDKSKSIENMRKILNDIYNDYDSEIKELLTEERRIIC